jgi:hypothetical protein
MLVFDSVSSPITKRVYNMALDEFYGWFQRAPRPGFTRATVSAWRVSPEERRLGSSSIIIRMSAIRELACETTDNGLLAPELAQGDQQGEKREVDRDPSWQLALTETGAGASECAGHLDCSRLARSRDTRALSRTVQSIVTPFGTWIADSIAISFNSSIPITFNALSFSCERVVEGDRITT